MRKAFTLIEMMISIVIFSIMMLFLYQTYSSLNRANGSYKIKANMIEGEQVKKRIFYLDFSLALHKSIKIVNQDKHEDIVFMQTSNSIHRRHNPYVAYIVKNKKLYRLESLNEIKEYPLSSNDEFIVDYMGDIEEFRVYKTSKKVEKKRAEIYLLHVNYTKENDILFKIKVLNDY